MSWVSARTERVHVSANVLDLPMRSPALIARSASSLDLLSEDRFELGIGNRRFCDAIETIADRGGHPMKSSAPITSTVSSFRVRAV